MHNANNVMVNALAGKQDRNLCDSIKLIIDNVKLITVNVIVILCCFDFGSSKKFNFINVLCSESLLLYLL